MRCAGPPSARSCASARSPRSTTDALADASALSGWSRAHLVAHLDGNARALTNLVTWARTGVETTMYSSMTQRDADIATGAALPPGELRDRFAQSRTALANGMAQLSEQAWGAEVRHDPGPHHPRVGDPLVALP